MVHGSSEPATLESIEQVHDDGRICIWSPHGTGRGITVMIDNYDSFTFNVAQLLVEEGANVVIFRNDKVSIETLESLRPVNMVISPGPGHPLTDAGISLACIKHFGGQIPILGICMGLQCMTVAFGGVVSGAGEIFHGKTSMMQHDGCGLFAGLSTSVPITGTRYHSLCAQIDAVPDVLRETAHVDSGVVMGLRHKTYTIEAVQYHPESVMSEYGHEMVRNFLSWRGGTWAENPHVLNTPASAGPSTSESILTRIFRQRKLDVAQSQTIPGRSLADLEASIALQLDPVRIDFPRRLLHGTERGIVPGIMAEIKRASPSKGDIAPNTHAAEQALLYARSGANVISVLTEPTWFKGTLEDLVMVRRVVECMPRRPAILRKDFILDEYQIAEARLAGADTVLLIVAMLDDMTLQRLYQYSLRLGMDPLVEVNNAEEMQRALLLSPKVIGVNNRNLHSFHVDMDTTSRLAQAAVERGVILVALSGIQQRSDVVHYMEQGVQALLVGEALMRAEDKHAFIQALQGESSEKSVLSSSAQRPRFVKVCGIQTPSAAEAAVQAGANLIGIILAPGTKRTVSTDEARAIRQSVHKAAPNTAETNTKLASVCTSTATRLSRAHEWFSWHADRMAEAAACRPLVVGVFRNQTLEEIVAVASSLQLDVIQLHGRTEELEWARYLPGVFVIRVFHVEPDMTLRAGALAEATRPGYHHVILFDSAGAAGHDGGSGMSFTWSHAPALATRCGVRVPFLVAGGLTAANVQDALDASQAMGVDTSSGVETDGHKDPSKIRAYVQKALE